MKCLLCNEWIEPVAQLSDLIMFKQRREYSCEDCKAQFKKAWEGEMFKLL